MVRSTHKIKTAFVILTVAMVTVALAKPLSGVSAVTQNVPFNVNIAESLTVTVTDPTVWASGNVNTLLRNKVTVSAMTNNYYGATVSMYADANILKNTLSYSSGDASSYINTLDKTYARSAFPDNAWGYSITDTDAGNNSANYLPVPTSATVIIDRASGTTGTNRSANVFFGAKATDAKQSGTYAQTVNFVAVTGVIDTDNPVNPVNPSQDNTDSQIATHTPSYSSTTGRTTYTTRTTNTSANTSTTTTQVTNGNVTSAYANAAGVTVSSDNSSAIVTALAVAAGVTAVAGTTFFILAKRDDDDDEDEEA